MAERRSRRRRPALGGLAVALVLAVGLPASAGASGPTPLTGWLAGGTAFPQRGLDLFPPAGTALSPARVHVTENGAPAGPLTVTSVKQAGPGDFGIEVIIDRSSRLGHGSLGAELAAVRSFAGLGSAQQELGVIGFDSRAGVIAPLTAGPPVIAGVGPGDAGANVPGAIALALSQLAQSHVALGAIVVIANGAGNLQPAGAPLPAAVRSATTAASVPVIGVALKDSAAPAGGPAALSAVVPGQVLSSTPARLSATLSSIYSAVSRAYVVRWTSHQPAGRTVNVVAGATGLTGSVAAAYSSPAAPGSAAHAKSTPPARHVSLSSLPQLARQPSFAANPAASATGGPVPATPPASAGASPFWQSSAGVTVIAVICGLLIALALAILLYRPGQQVRLRVGSYLPYVTQPTEELAALARSHEQANWLESTKWWPPFVENVAVARSEHTPAYLVKQAAAIGVIGAVLLALVSGTPALAILPLLGWPFALRAAMQRAARKQRDKFRDTLPGYLQDLASALRVGRSFTGALAVVADGADEPTRSELERAVTDEALGRPIEETLEEIAKRMQASDMEQVALVAALNRRSGSNVAEALDRVADGARDRADMRREVKALTAQAKMSSYVLTALPAVLLGGISLLSPAYSRPFFHTTMGAVLLVVGGLMVFAGWKVMGKIADVRT